ncbi:hypothetical protein BAJUN_00890 [Bajunvirus bajun]|uniref:Uncharacterized protein n=1 Tax=Brevundimonas phage vB_BgoS-Bajun TaxID=2948594 RepID=A0A9E7SRY0_9CAUD|nr:hypothetical protein BAJUN_00890 [Brevundimonas phage vB_BgoS-Bajun]
MDLHHVDAAERVNGQITWTREPTKMSPENGGVLDSGQADWGDFELSKPNNGAVVVKFTAKGQEFQATLDTGGETDISTVRPLVGPALLTWLRANRPDHTLLKDMESSGGQYVTVADYQGTHQER